MKEVMSVALTLAVALILTPTSAQASIAARADQVMQEVTARMTEPPSPSGSEHTFLHWADLIALYDAGERLYLRCGTQVVVAQEMLRRAGIRSRVVAAFSRSGPLDFVGGHTFMEVRLKKRWIAYDPDGNRQPLDAKGRPVNAARAVKERPFHWRYITADLYSDSSPYFTYEELDAAADRALGILLILPRKGERFVYHVNSTKLRQRVKQYEKATGNDYLYVGRKRWRKLIGP